MSDRYVSMAVLDKSRHMLTWLTCYGAAYDSLQLHEDEYNQAVSNAVDPFVFYKELCREKLNNLEAAQAEFRELGKAALKDTAYNRRVVYHSLQVKSAKSTLQQLMAIEDFIKRQYLQLYLFDSPAPSQLSANNNFLLHKSLAGKMVSKADTITYYAVSPLDNVAKMGVNKQDTSKVFIYDAMDHVLDSFPLRPGKYTALCKSRDDVFLLYRGWLEFQSQQVEEALQQITHLQHRQDTSLYFQAYRVENRRQLLLAEAELKAQQQDIERKINTLVIPDERSVKYMLQDAYPDKPAEINYMAGMGFGYIVSATRGEKVYELSDHRGNVMATASDRKMGTDNGDGTVTYYNADAVNANDYYPFGSLIPGRTYSSNEKYRYGFNGKENDNEVKGEGAQQDYGMRIYDPRMGRFLSVDPITAKYSELTPYQFASNTPIQAVDLDGLEKFAVMDGHIMHGPFLTNDKHFENNLQKIMDVVPYSAATNGANAARAGLIRAIYAYQVSTLEPLKAGNEIQRIKGSELRNKMLITARNATPEPFVSFAEDMKNADKLTVRPNGRFWVTNSRVNLGMGIIGATGTALTFYGMYESLQKVNAAPEAEKNKVTAKELTVFTAATYGTTQGATLGASVGGPWGGAAGGIIGGISGAIFGQKAIDAMESAGPATIPSVNRPEQDNTYLSSPIPHIDPSIKN